jgi:hypothetical protein
MRLKVVSSAIVCETPHAAHALVFGRVNVVILVLLVAAEVAGAVQATSLPSSGGAVLALLAFIVVLAIALALALSLSYFTHVRIDARGVAMREQWLLIPFSKATTTPLSGSFEPDHDPWLNARGQVSPDDEVVHSDTVGFQIDCYRPAGLARWMNAQVDRFRGTADIRKGDL